MRKSLLIIASCLAFGLSTVAFAEPRSLLVQAADETSPGAMLWLSSYEDLKANLPISKAFKTLSQNPVLQLTDTAYAKVSWNTVKLVFDRDEALSKIEMSTSREGYDALKARLMAGDDPLWSLSGNDGLISADNDEAVMICEKPDGSVMLTFNRAKGSQPKMMVARLEPLPSISNVYGE